MSYQRPRLQGFTISILSNWPLNLWGLNHCSTRPHFALKPLNYEFFFIMQLQIFYVLSVTFLYCHSTHYYYFLNKLFFKTYFNQKLAGNKNKRGFVLLPIALVQRNLNKLTKRHYGSVVKSADFELQVTYPCIFESFWGHRWESCNVLTECQRVSCWF